MIVTIDGPAGAGKSTVAKKLAQRLGFDYLDTGAMYRAVALAGARSGLDWDRPDDLARLARQLHLQCEGDRIWLDGEEVSETIRTSETTAVTRYAADNPEVRRLLVGWQQEAALGKNIVTEGRDQGTAVFPDAECKIFLTATAEERARRRVAELHAKGEPVTVEQVLALIERRDREDESREVGPLRRADDAVEVVTDGLSLEEVVDRLEKVVRLKE